ncbi:Uncharacterised protein [Escherichia coli]|nr:Uncharacterised protein [Escherichia coli]
MPANVKAEGGERGELIHHYDFKGLILFYDIVNIADFAERNGDTIGIFYDTKGILNHAQCFFITLTKRLLCRVVLKRNLTNQTFQHAAGMDIQVM